MSWNEDRIEALRKLWADGLSANQIATELGNGITRNAVIGKVSRLGLSGSIKRKPGVKPPPPPKAAKVLEARARRSDAAAAPKPTLPRQLPRTSIAPIPIAQPAREIPPPDEAKRVTILELRESMCKWPMGDPQAPEFRYCGADAPIGEGPYCKFHHRVAYQPPRDRSKGNAKQH